MFEYGDGHSCSRDETMCKNDDVYASLCKNNDVYASLCKNNDVYASLYRQDPVADIV